MPNHTITEQVTEFHRAFGFGVRDRPTIPDPHLARARLRLVAEEFFEFLAAHGLECYGAESRVMGMIDEALLGIDLVKVADACADLDYVIEGTRLEYGIPREPVAAEVHRSNMSKVGGEVVNGKLQKPDTYSPADVRWVLDEYRHRRDGYG